MKRGPVTPKGFRDIGPDLAKKRRITIDKIAGVLEDFGFVPIETPTLEFAETLLGKYGEEERLIYQFTDRGGRNLAMRFDLTVPLARYVANNLAVVGKEPFRRYQVGQVFRGENPQAGRYREFTQLDFDSVGSADPREDAKVIAAAISAARKFGLSTAKMLINDRNVFVGVETKYMIVIDKLPKIGPDQVKKELVSRGMSERDASNILEDLLAQPPTQELATIFSYLEREYNLKKGKDFEFSPTLVRGLDYYTSTIFELKPNGKAGELSIGGGGRYDNLIGMFTGKEIPAVGFSFGVDRLVELVP